jgi:hypothetical protein
VSKYSDFKAVEENRINSNKQQIFEKTLEKGGESHKNHLEHFQEYFKASVTATGPCVFPGFSSLGKFGRFLTSTV